MSEEAKPVGSGIEVTNEEVSRFMAARADRYACPICSNQQWLGMTDGTGRTAGIPWVSPQGGIETTFVRVLTMFCSNCGFVRSHELGFFKRYLQEPKDEQ
jgi:ribosomal protein S27AE